MTHSNLESRAPTDRQPAIEVRDLCHTYSNGQKALEDINLQIPEGTLFGLLGPNGSGKTTLFKILSTLIRATGGEATICGNSVDREPASAREFIGVTFQSPSIDANLTVKENMVCHGRLYGLSNREIGEASDRLLSQFELKDRMNERVSRLSGGLSRRVELAKTLMHRPKVLLMDEPSSGLDTTIRSRLMTDLRQLVDQDGLTCVITTHLMDEAQACDKIAFLSKGRLVRVGSPGEIATSLGQNQVTIDCSQSGQVIEWISLNLGGEPQLVNGNVVFHCEKMPQRLTELAENSEFGVRSLRFGPASLDDVFYELTGEALETT